MLGTLRGIASSYKTNTPRTTILVVYTDSTASVVGREVNWRDAIAMWWSGQLSHCVI